MTSGRRLMQGALPKFGIKEIEALKLDQAVLTTLAFFSLYDLPISSRRLHELLLGRAATLPEVESTLVALEADNKIQKIGNLYSLHPWKASDFRTREIEISKKWHKIDNYFKYLAVLPFVRMTSVINSLSMGTADGDSDIDFFVVTDKKRLYFVRSLIIIWFRILGVYKTRQKIKDRFCFGFFVSRDSLNLENLLIKPFDPYFIFWLANMRPILGGQQYWHLMQANQWLNTQLPNFVPMQRLGSVKQPSIILTGTKLLLELILWLPSLAVEPLLRRIHIKHTFKLAENNTVTSTTVANEKMLKLHGTDVRAEVAMAMERVLQNRE